MRYVSIVLTCGGLHYPKIVVRSVPISPILPPELYTSDQLTRDAYINANIALDKELDHVKQKKATIDRPSASVFVTYLRDQLGRLRENQPL
jgi:hypothetical protein